MQRLCLLGASGSVGESTLKVLRLFPEVFELYSFSVNSNLVKAKSIIEEFSPSYAVITSDEVDKTVLGSRFKNTRVLYGASNMSEIVKMTPVHIVVTAVVGSLGVLPTIAAIEAKKKIAIANKETLVTFGPYINSLLEKYKVTLVPVDSEHNALFQLVESQKRENISSLTLTASGGSFRDLPIDKLKNVTVEEALNHPTWKMGPKITIDSAGLVNKGLEVIEAHFLFGFPYEKIEVVIHPESIVHGMIELIDGATLMYASHPDMIYPIAHSLFFPKLTPKQLIESKPPKWKKLNFWEPNLKRYPALTLAYETGKKGGTAPALFNAANEEAVSLFLNHKIQFTQIPEKIDSVLQSIAVEYPEELEAFMQADIQAREFIRGNSLGGFLVLIILGAVLMLGISIFIHELGHLLCGMLVGVKARIFSIGYGRGIWKKRVGETTYQITGIPIGGYVMFKGDQYGKRLKGKEGELLSTPPLKRMIPVLGGPLFNLFLGFGIFFVLALMGDSSWGNRIFIDKANRDYSAAYQAGLRTGDRIIAINGKSITSFEDIFANVGLSGGEEIEVTYARNEETKSIKITPDVYSAGGRPTLMVEPYGERHIVVTFKYAEQFSFWLKNLLDKDNKSEEYYKKNFPAEVVTQLENKKSEKELETKLASRAIAYLKDGDMILDVEGKPVATIGELQTVLGNYQNQTVNIHLLRKTYPLLNPWSNEELTVQVPVRGSDILEFTNLVDVKVPALTVRNLTLAAHDPKLSRKLLNLRIDGQKFKNFEEIKTYLKTVDSKEVSVETGDLQFTAKYRLKPIGLLGFMADMKFVPESSDKKNSVADAFIISSEKVYRAVATSMKGIGMLFQGLISVKDNLSGPVGIVHSAGMSLEYGWFMYLNFVANISIALMFMNLLPIPVADGGHLVLYLYEAIAGKPLPPRAIDTIFKVGFLFLLLLGVFVTFNDVSRFF